MIPYQIRIPTEEDFKQLCGTVNQDQFPPTRMHLVYLYEYHYDQYKLIYTSELGWHLKGTDFQSDTFTYDASLILGHCCREYIMTTTIINSFTKYGHLVYDICNKIKQIYSLLLFTLK